jgi:hypothetical protein
VKHTLTLGSAAPWMFSLALRAMGEINVDDVQTHDKAVVSLICSCASLEAFVNELPGIAEGVLAAGTRHNKIVVFAALMNELEESQASLRAKLILAKWILSGTPLEKGMSPYQDVSALIDIRNALMHIKGSDVLKFKDDQPVFKEPRWFKFLRDKKLIAAIPINYEDATGSSWTEHIRNLPCAKWACHTVALTVRQIMSGLPIDEPWAAIRKSYESRFRVP